MERTSDFSDHIKRYRLRFREAEADKVEPGAEDNQRSIERRRRRERVETYRQWRRKVSGCCVRCHLSHSRSDIKAVRFCADYECGRCSKNEEGTWG